MKSVLLPLVGLSVALLPACAVAPNQTSAPTGGTVNCEFRVTNQAAKRVDPPSGTDVPATGTSLVTLTFAGGPVELTLDREAAPCTTHSFESLAQQDFFTDTSCHRLSTQGMSMLQCGDPTATGFGGPGYTFDDELAKTKAYPAGTVAMANSGPNTNGSQFFIVFADTQLPPSYTVFGSVTGGLEVIKAIAAQGTDESEGPGIGHPKADTRITAVVSG